MAKRRRDEAAGRPSVRSDRHANTADKLKPNYQRYSKTDSAITTASKKNLVNGEKSSLAAATSTSQKDTKKHTSTKVLKTDHHVDVKTELPAIQIIAGSYERVLHGITARLDPEDGQLKTTFADSFLFNAHASAVRCLALSPMPEDSGQGVFLATGGSDERVNVYSLSAAPVPDTDSKGRKVPSIPSLGPNKISENPMNRELGTLVQHSSSVTALHFPSRSKLLSASEDNTISITRVRDLEVVSTIKAPRPKVSGQASGDSAAAGTTPAGINDFAIHPSMKLMVSVGRGERSMRLWNLVTGKKAGVLNFDREVLQAVKEGKFSHGEGRKIRWNSDGTEFAIAFERGVVVFGQDSKAKCVLMPKRLTKVQEITYFLVGGQEYIAVSTDDGKILFFSTDKANPAADKLPIIHPQAYVGGEKQLVKSRIKDFQILNLSQHGQAGYLVVVGCSNGDIRLILLSESELLSPSSEDGLVGRVSSDVYSTGSRITCLVAFIMLPAYNIDGGLSEAESALTSDVEGEDSSE